MLAATNISENTKFAKYNSTPKFVDLQYLTHYAVTRVITRDFLRFQKTDFYFLFIFQYQVTRVTLTVSASSERRNNAALSLQNYD